MNGDFFRICFLFITFYSCINICEGYIDGLYCGVDNCYELLDVEQSIDRSELSKAYRKLAKKWHPDRYKTQKEKDAAAEVFTKIATAYEVLKDEESRRDYDYMLEHPEEYYSHYYRYYKRRVTPKVDPKIVIAVTITLISIVQYLSAHKNYNMAVDYFASQSKYRSQAVEIAKEQGLLGNKKKDKHKTKAEIKEEENAVLRNIIQDKMDIRGGFSKPKITDILWIQMFMWPWYILQYIGFQLRWFYRFTLKREEYGDEEKQYLIRKNFGLSQIKWEALEDKEKKEFMREELWIKEKFKEYKAAKEEEQKRALAGNAQYKRYRRYLKKGGPGQMAMGPE